MLRSFTLFFHLIGTLALFAGFGAEWLEASGAAPPLWSGCSPDSLVRNLPRVARTRFRFRLGTRLNGRPFAHGDRRRSQARRFFAGPRRYGSGCLVCHDCATKPHGVIGGNSRRS
jgi:hypothetical protein